MKLAYHCWAGTLLLTVLPTAALVLVCCSPALPLAARHSHLHAIRNISGHRCYMQAADCDSGGALADAPAPQPAQAAAAEL